MNFGPNDNLAAISEFLKATPVKASYKMWNATTHQERVEAIEDAIDCVAQELTRNRHLKQNLKEDEITIDFVMGLKMMGFQATHDTQVGGHCDILVEGRDEFLWIAEAKVHTSYGWLEKGMNQLSTRYSTGLEGQDCGEVLIYTYSARLDNIISEWHVRLKELMPDADVGDVDTDKLLFRSTHTHEGSGRPFRVRHKGVTLYFAPRD